MAGELLNGNPEHVRKRGGFAKERMYIRDKSVIKYIQAFFSQDFPDDVTHVGFSLFYDQARSKSEQGIWRFLADMPTLSVVHLQRLNTLRNLVSLNNAKATKRWMRGADEPVITYAPMTLDYDDCLNYFEKSKIEIQQSNHLFEARRMQSITYENLLADKHLVLQQLQQFLNLEPQELSSNNQIQNRQSMTDLIVNYRDLREKFRNSEWESFFDE